VRSLQRWVRDYRAGYKQSLAVLEHAKRVLPDLLTKSSLMLGLGETRDQVLQTFRDLRAAGVDAVTLGQYLQPTKRHLKVEQYVPPEVFAELRESALQLGFKVRQALQCRSLLRWTHSLTPLLTVLREWTDGAIELQGRRVLFEQSAAQQDQAVNHRVHSGHDYSVYIHIYYDIAAPNKRKNFGEFSAECELLPRDVARPAA
jgi:hypothetical protein